jgi:hypothetical protein
MNVHPLMTEPCTCHKACGHSRCGTSVPLRFSRGPTSSFDPSRLNRRILSWAMACSTDCCTAAASSCAATGREPWHSWAARAARDRGSRTAGRAGSPAGPGRRGQAAASRRQVGTSLRKRMVSRIVMARLVPKAYAHLDNCKGYQRTARCCPAVMARPCPDHLSRHKWLKARAQFGLSWTPGYVRSTSDTRCAYALGRVRAICRGTCWWRWPGRAA